jgi:hypothetical protein
MLAVTLMSLGATTALTTAPAASANTFYSCESCARVNGPNEFPIDRNFVENASGKGVCALLWRFNGGTSYTLMNEKCTSTGTQANAENKSGQYTAHGEAERWFECCNYHLVGDQFFE